MNYKNAFWISIVINFILIILAYFKGGVNTIFADSIARRRDKKEIEIEHDASLWKKSNEILSEKDLLNGLKEAETFPRLRREFAGKIEKVRYFFDLPSNKYINKELIRVSARYIEQVRALHKFLHNHVKFDQNDIQLEWLRIHPEDENTIEFLLKIIGNIRLSYNEYARSVKRILKVYI